MLPLQNCACARGVARLDVVQAVVRPATLWVSLPLLARLERFAEPLLRAAAEAAVAAAAAKAEEERREQAVQAPQQQPAAGASLHSFGASSLTSPDPPQAPSAAVGIDAARFDATNPKASAAKVGESIGSDCTWICADPIADMLIRVAPGFETDAHDGCSAKEVWQRLVHG